jgi:hypothetical protein
MLDKPLNYKKIPLSKEEIDDIKQVAPNLYKEMVEMYGIENVINNIQADFIILTESDKIIIPSVGQPFIVDANLIRKVCASSNAVFRRFANNAVNKVKNWVTGNIRDDIGYTPITTNHNLKDIEQRHGFIIGGSYKIKSIDGILMLCCTGILISPESKMNFINGLWREVSLTFQRNYSISELSFVNKPAQETNSSMSIKDISYTMQSTNNTEKIIIDSTYNINKFLQQLEDKEFERQEKLRQITLNAQEDCIQQQLNKKYQIAQNYIDKMIANGILTTGNKTSATDVLVSLSEGDIPNVAKFIERSVGMHSLFNRKPKTLLLRGQLDMEDLAKQEALELNKFLELNSKRLKNGEKLSVLKKEFSTEWEKRTVASMSAAQTNTEVSLIDPEQEILASLAKMEESGILSEDSKKKIVSACKLSDAGNMVKSGNMEEPNNTQLSLNESENHMQHIGEMEAIIKDLRNDLMQLIDVVKGLQASKEESLGKSEEKIEEKASLNEESEPNKESKENEIKKVEEDSENKKEKDK